MAVLLFDYDGVIADSFPAEVKYFLPICKRMNISGISTVEELRSLCDGNMFDRLKEIDLPVELYLEAFNEFHEIMVSGEYKVQPFPGIMDLMQEAASNLPVYIVTSNIHDFPAEMLSRHNVTGVKDILGLEKETSKVKKINGIKEMYPDEKIYFITDTIGDVIEAKDSLADEIIAVSWGWHDRKRLERVNPDKIFDSVEEFGNYVKKLF